MKISTRIFYDSTVLLPSVGSCNRVGKNTDGGRFERKEYKEQGNDAECCESPFFCPAGRVSSTVGLCLVPICNRRRNEENDDVDPIGRFADDTVVGVKENWDQCQPQKNAAQLDAPKIRAVTKEKGFYNGKDFYLYSGLPCC